MDRATIGWIQVDTEDLVIRTNVQPKDAVALAERYQRLRSVIAQSEFPCAFERSNAPAELVIFADQREIESLGRRYDIGFTTRAPSQKIDAKQQLVMSRRGAGSYTQLFVAELTYAAIRLCFPEAAPWFVEGMASFYETARIEGDELVIGMPRYGFVEMDGVEPSGDTYNVHSHHAIVTILPKRRAPKFDELRAMDEDTFYRLRQGKRSPDDFTARTDNYAGAWLAVHMLQLGAPDLSQQFERYLGELSRGEAEDAAWDAAFAEIDVASRYDDYLHGDYNLTRQPIDDVQPQAPTTSPMSQVEASLLWARLFGWRNEEDAAEARAYLDYARGRDPTSVKALLDQAAFESDVGEGEALLAEALAITPDDPEVLATAVRWYASMGEPSDVMRGDIEGWAERLAGSAQTAFQYAALAEYDLRVAGDAARALKNIDRALVLDATRWRTYALAGEALESLGRTEDAVQAYYTAIRMSGTAPPEARAWMRKRLALLLSGA
ncbi:MAG: bacterial transcriptional activator domain-containing protein [Myxococcota bacterium]